MKKNSHLTEEKIIDFVNNDLTKEEKVITSRHIQDCDACQRLYLFWHNTLNSEVDVQVYQKNKVWNSLHHKINHGSRLKKIRINVFKGLGVAIVCMIFFISGIHLGGNQQVLPQSPHVKETFLMDNNTVIYDLVHTSSGANKGYAWYNPNQKEVILYIDDNYHQDNYSYQAVIETKYSIINKQPVQLSNGKAQLYFQDEKLNDLNRIILTNESDNSDVNSYEFHVIPNMKILWK